MLDDITLLYHNTYINPTTRISHDIVSQFTLMARTEKGSKPGEYPPYLLNLLYTFRPQDDADPP
jgi:hypothetical protein